MPAFCRLEWAALEVRLFTPLHFHFRFSSASSRFPVTANTSHFFPVSLTFAVNNIVAADNRFRRQRSRRYLSTIISPTSLVLLASLSPSSDFREIPLFRVRFPFSWSICCSVDTLPLYLQSLPVCALPLYLQSLLVYALPLHLQSIIVCNYLSLQSFNQANIFNSGYNGATAERCAQWCAWTCGV